MMIIILDDPIIRCYEHGQSNPTYFVRYGGKNMVLRKKPVSTYYLFATLSHPNILFYIHTYSTFFRLVSFCRQLTQLRENSE